MAAQPTGKTYPWVHGYTTSGDLSNLPTVVNSVMDAYGNPTKPGSIHLDFLSGSFDGVPKFVTMSDAFNGSVYAEGKFYNNASGSSVSASCAWNMVSRNISAIVTKTDKTVLAEVPLGGIVMGQMVIEQK